MRHLFLVLLLGVYLSPCSWAAEADDDDEKDDPKNDVSKILENMGYPELQVVPRASERLRMEAKAENGSWFVTHWPIELSGLATFYAGYSSKGNETENLSSKQKDDRQTIATVAEAVGLAWVAGGILIGGQRPYANGDYHVRKNNGKDERSALLRERLAEEALEKPARTMRILQTVAVITNFTASAANALYVNDQGKMVAGVSAILAFLPLMFEDHNILVYEKHIEYKKKIYAPLKSASMHYDPSSKTLTPLTTLTWNF